ncbi:60Kd inner membrane protein-domain-containing protein [Mrakia frigida]|uniref:membrane insertase OXA1 n=1 Tax=Mrakia frigida TaxID=29902 RepID=UPI003FCBFDFE
MPPKGSNGVVGDQFLEPSQMADLAHVPIQIGDFKAMGLNGWFPTRLFQSIIEYIHVFTGLPWWATIVMATLLVRGTIAPMMVGNFRKAANMIVVAPQTKIYQDAMTKAKDEGDMATMTAVHKELTAHWKRHDCSPATLLVFPLVSIPLFMTMFFSVRAMADLPVPQLTVGGIPGWCLDLTAPDPTYILPVVAGGMTFLSMHVRSIFSFFVLARRDETRLSLPLSSFSFADPAFSPSPLHLLRLSASPFRFPSYRWESLESHLAFNPETSRPSQE